eukprot:4067268-Amphidinium_carterae.1
MAFWNHARSDGDLDARSMVGVFFVNKQELKLGLTSQNAVLTVRFSWMVLTSSSLAALPVSKQHGLFNAGQRLHLRIQSATTHILVLLMEKENKHGDRPVASKQLFLARFHFKHMCDNFKQKLNIDAKKKR